MSAMTPFGIWLYLGGIGAFTLSATVMDVRFKRIPNLLTVSFFGLAVLVHTVFFAGLGHDAFYYGFGHALGGFAVGFGVLFLLWMIGGGGGGDVKLMGALGAWLGPVFTIAVLFFATLFVVVLSIGVGFWSILTRGVKGTTQKYAQKPGTIISGKKRKKKNRKVIQLTTAQRQKRRIMAYALPVTMATWLLLWLDWIGRLPSILGS